MSETEMKSKAFDFDRAVAEARQDYPDVTAKITFVDLDAPDAAQQISRWQENRGEGVQRNFEQQNYSAKSDGFSFVDLLKDEGIVGVHSKPLKDLPLLSGQPDKQLWFVFYHELGHFMVPDWKASLNERETVSDSFAALCGLAKGFLTVDDIKSIADTRTEYFLKLREIEHMSAPVLDWIAANTRPGQFIGLEGTVLKQLAQGYALALIPDSIEQAAIEVAMFPRGKALQGLGDIAETSDALSLPFYIAARALSKAFSNATASGETPDFWAAVGEVISAKTEMLEPGLKKALQNATKAPVSVSPPAAGQ